MKADHILNTSTLHFTLTDIFSNIKLKLKEGTDRDEFVQIIEENITNVNSHSNESLQKVEHEMKKLDAGENGKLIPEKISYSLIVDVKTLHFSVSSLKCHVSLNQRALSKIVKKYNKITGERLDEKSFTLFNHTILDQHVVRIHNSKVRW